MAQCMGERARRARPTPQYMHLTLCVCTGTRHVPDVLHVWCSSAQRPRVRAHKDIVLVRVAQIKDCLCWPDVTPSWVHRSSVVAATHATPAHDACAGRAVSQLEFVYTYVRALCDHTPHAIRWTWSYRYAHGKYMRMQRLHAEPTPTHTIPVPHTLPVNTTSRSRFWSTPAPTLTYTLLSALDCSWSS